jgi:hypothetical protein
MAPGTSTTWYRGGISSTTEVILERSLDQVTWTEVRGATADDPVALDNGANQQVVVQDYEADLNVANYYRAKATVAI